MYKYIIPCIYIYVSLVGCLMELYILRSSKAISERVPTCEMRTIVVTLQCYPIGRPGHQHPDAISSKYQILIHCFDTTRDRTLGFESHDLPKREMDAQVIADINTHMHRHMCACAYAHMYRHTCVCLCICAYVHNMHTCISTAVYLFTDLDTRWYMLQ